MKIALTYPFAVTVVVALIAMGVTWAQAQQTDLPLPRPLHAPLTQEKRDFTPRPYQYVEPQRLNLPSQEDLKTVHLKGKTYTINKVAPLGFKAEERSGNRAFPGVAKYETPGESLSFVGSGRGGVESRERLIIEDCTFVIDFQEGDFESWNARRAAVYVEGYREVLVRNCVFVSKALADDPERKVTGSFVAYDCLKVQVEDSYFHGRCLGWRGHILVYCCGPTEIRNVEIDGANRPAGGIWVATGVGEGKIGWVHEDQPELMIYPAGPLLVENAYVHDEKGKENADGIYVQSIHPYLVRNCRVENWGPDDSLIDVGFRDAGVGNYAGKPLANHGAIGIVENCEFGQGWIKDSVGVAGGLIFRNNLCKRGTWMFPYVFDGGSWWVVNNRFEDMNSVIVSGKNGQLDGWTPKEGMFVNGSKMRLHRNVFEAKEPLKALYVAGAAPGPLKDVIVADHNAYRMPAPQSWGKEVGGPAYASFEIWRQQVGQDSHSTMGTGATVAIPADAPALELPGEVKDQPGTKIGLIGPVGVQNPQVLDRAKKIVAEATAAMASTHFAVQIESLGTEKSAIEPRLEKRAWAGGGAYLGLAPKAAGESAAFSAKLDVTGRFYLTTRVIDGEGGRWQLSVDGQAVGEPVVFQRRAAVTHGAVTLSPGTHQVAYTSLDGKRAAIDSIDFKQADVVDRDAARKQAINEQNEARKVERARVEALKTKVDLAKLEPTASNKGRHAVYGEGDAYRLWQPASVGASIEYSVDAPEAGRYAVGLALAKQQDKAELQLHVNGQPVGKPVRTEGAMRFGEIELAAGKHTFAFILRGQADAASPKIRLHRLELSPLSRP